MFAAQLAAPARLDEAAGGRRRRVLFEEASVSRALPAQGFCNILHSYAIKQAIEQNTTHKCSVVYGYNEPYCKVTALGLCFCRQLPPESRREQAKLFNERLGGFDVLVARSNIF